MSNWHDFLSRFVPYQKLLHFLQHNYVSKREGLSLYLVTMIFFQKIQDNDTLERSYAIAFSFTLAIFPALIFLINILAFIPDTSPDSFVAFLNSFLPRNVVLAADNTLNEIISQQRGDLVSFGFLSALYLASNGMVSLIEAFNKCYHDSKKRTYLRQRLIGTLLTIFLGFMIIGAMLLVILGDTLQETLFELGILPADSAYLLVGIGKLSLIAILVFFAVSIIFYFAPSVPIRWQFFSVGSVLASSLILLSSFAFSAYIENFATYNKLYGSIGAMIGLMVWLWLISLALMIGFEINASIDLARSKSLLDANAPKQLPPPQGSIPTRRT